MPSRTLDPTVYNLIPKYKLDEMKAERRQEKARLKAERKANPLPRGPKPVYVDDGLLPWAGEGEPLIPIGRLRNCFTLMGKTGNNPSHSAKQIIARLQREDPLCSYVYLRVDDQGRPCVRGGTPVIARIVNGKEPEIEARAVKRVQALREADYDSDEELDARIARMLETAG